MMKWSTIASQDNNIEVKNGAELFKKHATDAGFDVKSNELVTIPAQSSAIISTGLHIKLPLGSVGLLWSRSGLSVNHKIEVGAGCIDYGYEGEVKVHLYNHSNTDYTVMKGDRIAQLLVIPIMIPKIEYVDELSPTSSERESDGFGSTGI